MIVLSSMRHRGFEPDYTLETLEKKGAFRVAYISVTKSVTLFVTLI